MSPEQTLYLEIGHSLNGAAEGQLFGKPCFKTGGKAFICFFESCMVFKLGGDAHSEAIALKDAELFDPSKKGRPMKEWVQVPFAHKKHWKRLAAEALRYVQPTWFNRAATAMPP